MILPSSKAVDPWLQSNLLLLCLDWGDRVYPRGYTKTMESRIQTLHPAWGTLAMSASGVSMVSFLEPLPDSSLDTSVGLVLLVLAVVAAILVSVGFTIKGLRYPQNFLSDLSNPGFGSQTAAWPAALLILSLSITQAGSRGLIDADLSLVSGAVLFSLGLVGTFLTGLAFFSNVIGRADIPAQAITASWFVPVVPLVLVPSIMVRFTQLAPEFDKTTASVIGLIGWGIGFGLFLLLAAVIGGRLLTHEPPPPHAVASWWAWLAPIGAGSLGIAALSVLLNSAFGWSSLSEIATFVISAMWGFALWWAVFAGLIVIRQLPKATFHVGLWGFGFPTAALISLTLEVGRRLDVAWIGLLGSVLWVLLLIAIALLSLKTIQGLNSGKIWQR